MLNPGEADCCKYPLPIWCKRNKTFIFLSILITCRLFYQIYLFHQGFVSVSADEFGRTISAYKWATNPYFFIVYKGGWLPFEQYLNGFFLMIWDNVILMPRITAFAASCLLLVYFFRLIHYLFSDYYVAVISSLIVCLHPWFIWLSGTPMLDIYYISFIITGLYYLCVWLKEQRQGYWAIGAICIFFASGFHVQSWVVINIVNLLSTYFLFGFIKNKNYGSMWRLIAFYFISNLFVFVYITATAIETGSFFSFIASHTDYSKWYYKGYRISVLAKLLHYPKIVLKYGHVLWFFLPVALYVLVQEDKKIWKSIPFVVGIMSLGMFSVFNLFSVPATAAPDRYCLLYIILFSPYIAYGFYRFCMLGIHSGMTTDIILKVVLPVVILVAAFSINICKSHFFGGLSYKSVAAGKYIGKILEKEKLLENETFLIELRYWEYYAVRLAAKHYDRMILDRERDSRNRDIPSVFEKGIGDITTYLGKNKVRFMVLKRSENKGKASEIDSIKMLKKIGPWTIYEVDYKKMM